MIKVYIASPCSNGDVLRNVGIAFEAMSKLIDAGFNPYAPLSHFPVHMFYPKAYDKWLEMDLEWVSGCDCVLRLDGYSPGADLEVKHAKELGIPVFYNLSSLVLAKEDLEKETQKC